MGVAATSDPITESATVLLVPRPATGKTFVARARVPYPKWKKFGQLAAHQDTDRSKLINEFIDWYLRERGAVLPGRPSRQEIEQVITQPAEQD